MRGYTVNNLVVSAAPSPLPVVAPRTIQIEVLGAEDASQFSARHAGTPEDEAQAVAGLSASLASLLAEHGLTTAPAGQAPDLILRCLVTDARSGSKLKRIVIGLGAGQARLQLQVSLIDPRINQQPVLSFETGQHDGKGARCGHSGRSWWSGRRGWRSVRTLQGFQVGAVIGRGSGPEEDRWPVEDLFCRARMDLPRAGARP